jgi:hypothetical protein
MKDMKRSIRRHHRQRLIQTRLKNNYWNLRNLGSTQSPQSSVVAVTPTQLGILGKKPKVCSCRLCGNARRYFGSSLKELSDLQLELKTA